MIDRPSAVPTTAVIGLQFGDEGKGQLTDVLAQEHDIVVRYNGGANAGHTVYLGNERYALHQIPLGILTPSTLNVLSNGVALDAEAFLTEVTTLRRLGIDVGNNLRVSDRAHLVMPYHKLEDVLREHIAQTSLGPERSLGTTKRGIGPCYADKASRDTALRVGDLFDQRNLRDRLRHIAAMKNTVLGALSDSAGTDYTPIDADNLQALCQAWAGQIEQFVCDTAMLLHQEIANGRRVLFEGAHAALLDVDHGTYPYVTSSNSSALGISSGSGVPPNMIGTIVGVAKLYISRVGTGPFVTEQSGDDIEALRIRAGEYGTTTGRPRRLGWLDIPSLQMAARINGVATLCLTGLSMLAGMTRIRICVGYRYRGETIDALPASVGNLEICEPVYEDLPGFTESVGDCRSFDELPRTARALVGIVEQRVARVGWVCVGKRRDQILKL